MSDQSGFEMEDRRDIDPNQVERAVADLRRAFAGIVGENHPLLTQEQIDDNAASYQWGADWIRQEIARTVDLSATVDCKCDSGSGGTLSPLDSVISSLPLGPMPRWIHEQQRASALLAAIRRYEAAGLDVPVEWREELAELRETFERWADRLVKRADREAGLPADDEAAESWRDRPTML